MDEIEEIPICSECGKQMKQAKVAVKLNRFCIKHLEGWFCPNSTVA